jgi:hypothetical protein
MAIYIKAFYFHIIQIYARLNNFLFIAWRTGKWWKIIFGPEKDFSHRHFDSGAGERQTLISTVHKSQQHPKVSPAHPAIAALRVNKYRFLEMHRCDRNEASQ